MKSGLFNSVFLIAALAAAFSGSAGAADAPSPSPRSTPASFTPSPTAVPATPVPPLPVQEVTGGFTRYIPNRDGDMEWKLEGSSVHFLTPTCMQISDLLATALAPDISDLTINAGLMLFHTDTKIARGEDQRITVRRENMVLTGRGYLWTPQSEQIRVFEDVQLLIKETGNQGLFPL